jgi:hypothetical protein
VPTLNAWSAQYGQRGLRIVAIHSRGSGRPVEDAVQNWGITYPVADDRDGKTWQAYSVRATPTYALIAPDGSLSHRQVGLVTTPATAERIEALLAS